jgi:hypothetical protein
VLVRISLGAVVIVAGAIASLVGSALPWAIVSTGSQLNSLTNLPISVSISAMDIDAGFALGVIAFAIVAIACAAAMLLSHSYFRQLAAVAIWAGAMAAGCAVLAIQRAQGATAPAGLLGDIANMAGLVSVQVGFGIWLAIGGGAVVALGGLLAWAER